MKKVVSVLIDNNDFLKPEEKEFFLDLTLNKIRSLTDEVYYTGREEPNSELSLKKLDFSTSYEFLDFLRKDLKDTNVIILNAFSPLFDLSQTEEMLSQHEKYVFDYSYTENLPEGLLPEIISTSFIEYFIQYIPENLPLFKKTFRELIEREISSYDCNIFITESEISKYRIDFVPSNPNNLYVIKNIIENYKENLSIQQIERIISENPAIIRYRPTYYEIELTTEREKGRMFASSLLKREGFMKLDHFKNILNEIKKFSFNPVVSLGLFGEPFLHPEIDRIIEIISAYPEISFLFESRGIFLNTNSIKEALKLKNASIIFDISFEDVEKFKAYKTPLNPVLPEKSFITLENEIKSLPEREKIYIQFTRNIYNEEDLIKFYERWKDFKERIIIKKLDTFGGNLSNLRVVDLSPVKRFFCYHLKNDMVIYYNGDVPICREDINGENLMGNIFKDGIEKCWNEMKKFYLSHFKNEFLPECLCKNCDDWWIFNF
ncbi:MAG: spiro-SPASM protein [Brevinematia bacterium]